MIRYKAVLFDMDGVLVNSEPVITRAAVLALREFGVEAAPEDFLPFTGMGEDGFIGGVTNRYGKPYRAEMKDRAYEIYGRIIPDLIEVYPGAVPLLWRLREAGVAAAVASSADVVKVRANLSASKIPEELFCAVITGNDVKRKKPFPDIYLEAASRCGVQPADCAVVEDAVSGVQAAKAAGMRCIAVTTSFDEHKLREAGADEVCGDVGGVWGLLSV